MDEKAIQRRKAHVAALMEVAAECERESREIIDEAMAAKATFAQLADAGDLAAEYRAAAEEIKRAAERLAQGEATVADTIIDQLEAQFRERVRDHLYAAARECTEAEFGDAESGSSNADVVVEEVARSADYQTRPIEAMLDALIRTEPRVKALVDALSVLMLDEHVAGTIARMDPKAHDQAREALASVGVSVHFGETLRKTKGHPIENLITAERIIPPLTDPAASGSAVTLRTLLQTIRKDIRRLLRMDG